MRMAIKGPGKGKGEKKNVRAKPKVTRLRKKTSNIPTDGEIHLARPKQDHGINVAVSSTHKVLRQWHGEHNQWKVPPKKNVHNGC